MSRGQPARACLSCRATYVVFSFASGANPNREAEDHRRPRGALGSKTDRHRPGCATQLAPKRLADSSVILIVIRKVFEMLNKPLFPLPTALQERNCELPGDISKRKFHQYFSCNHAPKGVALNQRVFLGFLKPFVQRPRQSSHTSSSFFRRDHGPFSPKI